MITEAKAFGTHGKHSPLHPSLSKRGRANRDVKQSVDHGFRVLGGLYRKNLTSFLAAPGARPQKAREAFSIIVDHYTKAFRYGLLSRGGLKRTPRDLPLSPENIRWIRTAAREEAGYLLRYLTEYPSLTKSKAEYRTNLYVKALEAIFTAGKVSATPHDRFVIIKWNITPQIESCPGCIYLSKVSYFTKESLPCIPKDGTTPCLSHCRCYLTFETVDAARYNQVIRTWTTKARHLARISSLGHHR